MKTSKTLLLVFVIFCGCSRENNDHYIAEDNVINEAEMLNEYREDVTVTRDSKAVFVRYEFSQRFMDGGVREGFSKRGWLATYVHYLKRDKNIQGYLMVSKHLCARNGALEIEDNMGSFLKLFVDEEMNLRKVLVIPDFRWGISRPQTEIDCSNNIDEIFCSELKEVFDEWYIRMHLKERICEGIALPEFNWRLHKNLSGKNWERYRPIPEEFSTHEQKVYHYPDEDCNP